jgi:hypothetical protein
MIYDVRISFAYELFLDSNLQFIIHSFHILLLLSCELCNEFYAIALFVLLLWHVIQHNKGDYLWFVDTCTADSNKWMTMNHIASTTQVTL